MTIRSTLTVPLNSGASFFAPVPRVVAIIMAHNEDDILEATLSYLTGQGMGVYFIDNWSTDDTAEIARSFLGRGVIGMERHPADGDGPYDFRAGLRRKVEIAAELARLPGATGTGGARWIIHYDADELRDSPWPGVSLFEGLMRVESEGYNAVDHVVLHFVPIREGFRRGMSPADYFRHFVSLRHASPLRQVKAWLQNGQRVDLDTFAGHSAEFSGRRVYPIPFLIKHYSIRSTAHGRRKILADRLPRFAPRSLREGLHSHYLDLQRSAAGSLIYPVNHPELQVYDEIPFKRAFLAQTFQPEEETLQRQVHDLCQQLSAARTEILRLKEAPSARRYRWADRAWGLARRIGILRKK